MDLDTEIRMYALENAVKFKGKANQGAVVGKLLAAHPELKKELGKLAKQIGTIIGEVNGLSDKEQEQQFAQFADKLVKKEVKKQNIFSMFDIKEGDTVKTAFPPEPSKYPHIGHAKAIILNYELAKKYNGTFALRFEDTNPTLAKQEYIDIHLANYKWLGIVPDEIIYASDYMDKYRELCLKLIEEGHVYVDRASQDQVKESRMKGKATKDRNNSVEDNKKLWEAMQTAEEGTHIVRLKIDLKHKNSTMRDPTIMRIIDHKHPRTKNKYRVWPAYDFENSVMDGIQGITHRLRSKEFELRTELQHYIQGLLGFTKTNLYEFARFNLQGVESSGRVIRELIEQKKLIGWDDPTLTTLMALKRRGFTAKAVKSFVLSTGISKAEATLTWDDLIMHNKRVLDKEAKRYFFIKDNKKITVEGAPEQTVTLPVHPEDESKGKRTFKTHDKFIIEQTDFDKFEEGKLYRLMDCLNFKFEQGKCVFDSLDYESYKKNGHLIIHFLPQSQHSPIGTEIMMPDKTIIEGIAEEQSQNINVGEVIQFQRFGFCRLDKKENGKLFFWFTH